MGIINSFRGDYYFLSNMYPCSIKCNGLTFSSAESLFHAFKDPASFERFASLDGYSAKREGRKVTLRKNWNEFRLGIMRKIVRAKFMQNKDLALKLLATGDDILIEGNNWNDTFWGYCNGKGENHLGIILMDIRDELKVS